MRAQRRYRAQAKAGIAAIFLRGASHHFAYRRPEASVKLHPGYACCQQTRHRLAHSSPPIGAKAHLHAHHETGMFAPEAALPPAHGTVTMSAPRGNAANAALRRVCLWL